MVCRAGKLEPWKTQTCQSFKTSIQGLLKLDCELIKHLFFSLTDTVGENILTKIKKKKRCHISTIRNKMTKVKRSEEDLEMQVGYEEDLNEFLNYFHFVSLRMLPIL